MEENTSGCQAIVSIRDSGIGIDPEILPRLFCKFVTKSFDGSGLGLHICKGIIEAHGGNIWAKNNADGKGATFSFTLPLPTRETKIEQNYFIFYASCDSNEWTLKSNTVNGYFVSK